jgi:RNA polymerase sigma-70 factor (ECF subfamily)
MNLKEALAVEIRPPDMPTPSFDDVYAEHFDFVWRNLRRLGVAESGLRDAAQEVFIVVHRRLHEFVPHGSLRSWLYSILRRIAASQNRQHRRTIPTDPEEADLLSDENSPDPEHHVAREQSLNRLLTMLRRLDEDKRDALVIVDLEGMSVPEACAALQVNQNTLYSRLRAARIQMRQIFAREKLVDWRQL